MARYAFVPALLGLLLVAIQPTLASPQGPPGGGGGGGGFGGFGGFPPGSPGSAPYTGGSRPGSGGGSGTGTGTGTGSGSTANPQSELTSATFQTLNHVLIAHAVLAVLAWAFFIPLGAIVLRLNTRSSLPAVRLHAACQVFAYMMYIAAAALGIFYAGQIRTFDNVWSDPHPKIGLLILVVALFQPLWGSIHHHIYQRRDADIKAGRPGGGPRPARTGWGRVHVWIGRVLVTLAIINGGLGLRLAGRSPLQTPKTTKNAQIAYGVLAGLMWLAYVAVTALYEYRKAVRLRRERRDLDRHEQHVLKDTPPAYSESDESL